MTNREWVALNPTWKGSCRRAYAAKRTPYWFFRLHCMVNCRTMFVKAAFFYMSREKA